MPSQKPKSRQELLQQQRRSGFIGRTEQLQQFRQNLHLPPEDWQFLFNVSGQGGVGKTTLLKQFRQLAEQKDVLTAWSDDSEKDVPEAIGRLAEELEKAGHKLPQTQERYKVYRQKKQELEADPEAPQGFSAWVGKTVVKAGLGLAKQIPGSGAVTPFLDEEGFANKAGDWAAFVAKKLTNKDEVKLLQDPKETLTPIFLAELGKLAEQKNLALFFDTYEKTSDFLDAWLAEILEGEYGELPMNVMWAIAGRQPLEMNRWAAYQDAIVHFPLDAFTVAEAKEFLQQKGVTQPQIVGEILRLSDRLPVLVAMLAQNSPQDPSQILEPSQLAVERFLQWEPDAQRRQAALDGALPLRLNRDTLAQVVGAAGVAELFAWLQRQPFVEERHEGWAYHLIVRGQMLRYKRRESPQGWAELQGQLAEFYQQQRQELGLSEETQQADPVWQDYTLQILYHRLCQNPQKHLPLALNEFLAALKQKQSFAKRWAATMLQAGKDTETAAVQDWGENLTAGLQAYDEQHYDLSLEMFTTLIHCAKIELQWRSVALAWRGEVHRLMKRYEAALQDFDRAIELDPKYSWAIAHRGRVYQSLKQYEKALNDFNRAIEFDPKYIWVIFRSITYQSLKQYEEALSDFNRVIELDPKDSWAIAHRGQVYQSLKRYEEAITDFNQAIELNPKYSWAIANRGEIYQSLKQYEAALSDFNHAIELDPKFSAAIAVRGETYRLMEQYEAALSDFNRAIELDPKFSAAIAARGEAYRLMEQYEAALRDFNRAIELDPKDSWAIAHRGQVYQSLKRYEAAINDFNQALELNPKYSWAIADRGFIYWLMKQYEAALNDFNRALELNSKLTWAIAVRGLTHRLMKQYGAAISDFDRVIELDPKSSTAISNRGEIYLMTGQYDEALKDFDRALELDPESNWKLYDRSLTYQALNQPEQSLSDITQAIDLAQQQYNQDAQDWSNTFNLALYHLAAGAIDQADVIYRQALAQGASVDRIQAAIQDLDDLLTVFPNQPEAVQMKQRLTQALNPNTTAPLSSESSN